VPLHSASAPAAARQARRDQVEVMFQHDAIARAPGASA